MSDEQFKKIPGFEGEYLIGNYGTVISTEFRNNQVVKPRNKVIVPTDNGNGYKIVFLRKNGVRKRFYVHRLVASQFLEKQNGKSVINHKDHNKANNRADNLEWCTQKENVRYSAERMRREKKKCKPTNTGEKYISYRQGRYRVCVKKKGVDKSFGTLNEAVTFRNEVINGEINT